MITAPNSLDNYFSSQLSRRTSQLPLNLNINNINYKNSNTINYVITIYIYSNLSNVYYLKNCEE
jgi:hypothetical protein